MTTPLFPIAGATHAGHHPTTGAGEAARSPTPMSDPAPTGRSSQAPRVASGQHDVPAPPRFFTGTPGTSDALDTDTPPRASAWPCTPWLTGAGGVAGTMRLVGIREEGGGHATSLGTEATCRYIREDAPTMPRTQPVTTRVRDLYDEYAEIAERHIRLFAAHADDGAIDPGELADLAPLLERKRQIREELGALIAEADDGLRVAMAYLHGGGTPSRHTRRMADEYETLHGPVQIEHYQHTETRRSHGHGNDAA